MLLQDPTDAPPMHGYRGVLTPGPMLQRPKGLTIAISREAGARGSSIAARVAERLGWQVFNQEMLGFLTQNQNAREELFAEIPPEALQWANAQVAKWQQARRTANGQDLTELVRLVFVLAARGEVIIVGRGAGLVLPKATSLAVRIVAPKAERVAYIGQWLRLSDEDATKEVANRDAARSQLHTNLSAHDANDLMQYDCVLNSSRLGEAACTELIVQAIRIKQLTEPAPWRAEQEPV